MGTFVLVASALGVIFALNELIYYDFDIERFLFEDEDGE